MVANRQNFGGGLRPLPGALARSRGRQSAAALKLRSTAPGTIARSANMLARAFHIGPAVSSSWHRFWFATHN